MTSKRQQRMAIGTLIVIAIPVAYVIVTILGTLIGAAIAHADPVPVAAAPAAPAPGWSLAEVMALIALIVAGVGALVDAARAVLHFTAPRTASTWDDRQAARLDAFHDRLRAVETLIPNAKPAAAPPAVVTGGIIGPIAIALLAAGSLLWMAPACATVKAIPGAAKTALVECAKADAVPILELAGRLGAQALIAAIDQGAIDWHAMEEAAAGQGKVVGGCALTKFVAALAQAPRSDTAARALAAGPDPVADGKAAIARLSTRFDGATWSVQ